MTTGRPTKAGKKTTNKTTERPNKTTSKITNKTTERPTKIGKKITNKSVPRENYFLLPLRNLSCWHRASTFGISQPFALARETGAS